ncbi:MAG: endonuclease [Actinomycetota bacterium]|nr:endonuclease [Actinomycetota bacterium]
MPEGHTVHRLAREFAERFQARVVSATSPQGRFAEGAALLDGRRLEGTEAYGKHLFLRFAGERILHVHLGLYGKWAFGPTPAPDPWGALRVRLVADGSYADLRGATACEVWTPEDEQRLLHRLGPDPLRDDADEQQAWQRIARARTPIGVLLMDQSVLAGVGNVYRAEALFRARINPHRPGRELDRQQWRAMWQDIVVLMRAGLRAGRIVTTRPADRSGTGRVRPEDAFYVYRRAGDPCRICGTPIATEVIAGRNLFWCPTCQAG